MTDLADIDPTQIAKARVGAVLRGKWRLVRLLGIGGMAAVYEAEHRNGARFAVKILHPHLSALEDTYKRFLREGYVANQIEHRGVVRVVDDDVAEDGSAFLVMDLLRGRSVDRLLTSGPLQPARALDLADRLLDVLAAAHDKGIVHRDIKPENLFLTDDAELKVLDFGIARMQELASGSGTLTGMVLGTPAFMPPEQARGLWDEVDARTDLWSVGATLYSLLAGELPRQARTANEALLLAMTVPLAPMAQLVPGLAPEVARVIDRAVAFERGVRWASAREMQRALREAAVAANLVQDTIRLAPEDIERPPSSPLVIVHAQAPRAATLSDAPVTSTLRARRERKMLAVAALGAVTLVGAAGILAILLPTRTAPAAPSAAAAPRVVEQAPREREESSLRVAPAEPADSVAAPRRPVPRPEPDADSFLGRGRH